MRRRKRKSRERSSLGCGGSSRRRALGCSLPPPIEDRLIHLLPQGYEVGIGEGGVEGAHAVRVAACAADGAVELGLVHFNGRAGLEAESRIRKLVCFTN